MQYITVLDDILYRVRIYREPQRVRSEVIDLIRQYPSLYPVQGSMQPGAAALLHLVGTIPIIYGGVHYNIPVKIWIVDTYPYAPPLVYVTPTPDMIITPRHKNVDSSGMVYLPYLNTWSPHTCNLSSLSLILSKAFSEEPPVRSQPAGARASAATPSPAYPSAQTPNSSHRPLPAQPPVQPPPYPYVAQEYYAQPPPQPVTEDPAVVLRRNTIANGTEMLQRRLREFYEATTKEIDETMRASSDINARAASYDKERDKLLRSIEQCDMDCAQADSLLHETMRYLATQEQQAAQPDIDAQTDPRDPLVRQLLQLVAEDATIEDGIYHLDQNCGAIPLDEYLKQVRKLSRDQFFIRATIKKVHEAQRNR